MPPLLGQMLVVITSTSTCRGRLHRYQTHFFRLTLRTMVTQTSACGA